MIRDRGIRQWQKEGMVQVYEMNSFAVCSCYLSGCLSAMKIGKWQETDWIKIDEVTIEEVEDFCYSRSGMTSNSSCHKEIKTRLAKVYGFKRISITLILSDSLSSAMFLRSRLKSHYIFFELNEFCNRFSHQGSSTNGSLGWIVILDCNFK